MKKYIIWILLAVLMICSSVVEGVVEDLPRQLVQAYGILTLLYVTAFVVWTLTLLLRDVCKKK